MQGFDHSQASSSASWTVTHNLNTDAVAIDVFVNAGGPGLEKILPADVVRTDVNTITVTFSQAYTGVARVVGTVDA